MSDVSNIDRQNKAIAACSECTGRLAFVALPIQVNCLSMPVLSDLLHNLRTDRLQRRKATNIFI